MRAVNGSCDEWSDEREERSSASAAFLGGLGLGVVAMYFLDPSTGGRRRALVRDQAVHWQRKVARAARATAADVRQRTRGVIARVRGAFDHEPVPDELLLERVRAVIGHRVWSPRGLRIAAHDGRVLLRGWIREGELEPLLRCIDQVRGVREVDHQLEVRAVPKDAPHPLRRNWSPTTRLLASSVGLGGILYGARRQHALDYALLIGGAGILTRALADSYVARDGYRNEPLEAGLFERTEVDRLASSEVMGKLD